MYGHHYYVNLKYERIRYVSPNKVTPTGWVRYIYMNMYTHTRVSDIYAYAYVYA
jgi:hypothetical protein